MIQNHFSNMDEKNSQNSLNHNANLVDKCNKNFRRKRCKRFLRKNNGFFQINMIPLIDILLVLLIVFMITAETINNNIDINLPNATSTNKSNVEKITKKDDIVVYIDSKEEIGVNDRKFLNLEEFKEFLNSGKLSLKSNNSENIFFKADQREIILSGDKNVHYQKIIEVLIALNNVGLTKIKMAYKNS